MSLTILNGTADTTANQTNVSLFFLSFSEHADTIRWSLACFWNSSPGVFSGYSGFHPSFNRLVGLAVRRPPRERKIPGSNPACAEIFSGSSHTSDSKTGTSVATLPGAWRYRVSTGTGRPGVSILWMGEVESLICNFYISVAALKIVWADPSLRYSRMLLGH